MAYGLGVAKGMLTTISHLIKPPVTIQYPEERLEMPIWTRGRPRLIYEVDTGDLRCTACGACALACPVDVIKIEQHPSPIKGKVLDRFDIDMAGCIECALCVEACPFRAITMAPDFEMVATFDRSDRPGLRHVRAADRGHSRDRRGHGAHPGRQARPEGPGRAGRGCPASRSSRARRSRRHGARRTCTAAAAAGTAAAAAAPRCPAAAAHPPPRVLPNQRPLPGLLLRAQPTTTR